MRPQVSCRSMQRDELKPSLRIIGQSPVWSAVITQPEVFYDSSLLAGPYKWRSRRLTGPVYSIRFDQKQLAFPQSQERFSAIRISALAEHGVSFLLAKQISTSFLDLHGSAFSMPELAHRQ
jgi:hypothetical protein